MWVVGQRVLAEFEPELGLGIVIKVVQPRILEVLFPGAEVVRRYTQTGAPLRRLVLEPGQKAKTKDGRLFTVASSQEIEGLLKYKGEGAPGAWEYELDHVVEDLNPIAQCLAGRWSPPKTFELREKAWRLLGHRVAPEVKGLVGPRVTLLPHQLYIASEVAGRELPRVLLADEVGLGKTIEAGLIFSTLRALGRAGRVLILAPESLKHQWLAEMYRRFNEMFSVIDEDRSEAEELSQGRSAFQMNQKIICSLEFLLAHTDRLEEAAAEPWDLIIIDEAHHLEWSEESPSAEWEVAKLFSQITRGLLLLTATPEHRGMETEYGLLQLVDAECFPSFSEFRSRYKAMHETAELAREIHNENRSPVFLKSLETTFGHDSDLLKAANEYGKGAKPEGLLRRLIDRHGTGRVLIRNRRARLKGFPERQYRPHPLPSTEAWTAHLAALDPKKLEEDRLVNVAGGMHRTMGSAAQSWFKARGTWLLKLLKDLDGEKVLLICSSSKRAIELQNWLRQESSLRTGLFHEDLEIVERDRQAAWFSEKDGAQVLLCSEIGGEGRNFQFASHLVLFDLPLHPDIVEQRIGRLDRIGQKKAFQIHIPFVENTPEEVLARWYAEGLQSFSESWNGGAAIDAIQDEVIKACHAYLPRAKSYPKREAALRKLVEKTRVLADEIREKQRTSVDLLIDLNSYDEARGKHLMERIRHIDEDPELQDFMEATFDHFGVEVEEMDGAETLKVSAHSLTFAESFPGLTSHGERVITYQRNKALEREEIDFLTWDHPIAQGALSLVVEGDTGRVAAGVWSGGPRKTPLFFELLYVLQPTAPAHLELDRDLPLQPLKIFLTPNGELVPPPEGLESANLKPAPTKGLEEFLVGLRRSFDGVMRSAEREVGKLSSKLIEEAVTRREKRLRDEHERLASLAQVNKLVTKAELERHKARSSKGVEALRAAVPRLEAIRLIFVG